MAQLMQGPDLVKALVAERYRQGIRQDVLADRMGIARPTIGRFETECLRRRSPSIDIITRYAEALGVEIAFELKPKDHGDG